MTNFSRSITTRLAVAIVLILVAGGAGVTVAALAYGRKAAEEAYDKLLAGAAFEITRSISVSGDGLIVDMPTSAFEILGLAPEDRVFYRVYRDDAETLTGYDDLPSPTSDRDVAFNNGVFRDAPIRLVTMRRSFVERAFAGDVHVVVAQTLRARSALSWEIARQALVIVGLVGVILSALAAIAVRSSLSPLRKIENVLVRRDPLDLTPLDVDAPSEVSAMIGSIDRFMARLSKRVAAMQSLLADATHQLRTPIAALRAQAELAMGESDDARLREINGRIHRRAVGLSRLADQLLNQALIIHRADAVAREAVDLRNIAIVASQESDHDLLSTDASLRLDLDEEPVMVLGDSFSLVEATKNLVNNAFRHGEAPVTIRVRGAGAQGAIDVIDRGDGLDDVSAETIGQRFGKPSSTHDGAGIGLAIVRAVAEAHGGGLHLAREADRGFVVGLRLRRVTPREAAS